VQRIHSRIALGKKIFMDKKRLFTGKIKLVLKKRIIKCTVCCREMDINAG